jgi:hypothetical protein
MVGKNVNYVKINDSVVVITDVSEKVAGFFVSKSFDILNEPGSKLFSLKRSEYSGETVL